MQGGSLRPYATQAPAPPVGYVSSTLVSDLETDLADEEDEEEEGYEMSRPLRGIEHTPGSSMDNLDSSVTGEPAHILVPCQLDWFCITVSKGLLK